MTESSRVIGAIPARFSSERLPGKPLRLIAGRPMIVHVVERARRAEALDEVVVLTDDERIAAAVDDAGGRAEMTPAGCTSGTDRIAWAVQGWGADVAGVVNIQGDEPLVEPEAIDRLARHLLDSDDDMVTLAAPALEAELDDSNAVKVVTSLDGYALYFSRSKIPYPRTQGPSTTRRHIGLYGYRVRCLLRLAELEPSPLERTESLEQLRALEHGMAIRVLDFDGSSPGVDTEADLLRVEQILARRERE